MGLCLLQHVRHRLAFSIVTRSEVYTPCHYSGQQIGICIVRKHVLINAQCLLPSAWPLTLCCLPPSQRSCDTLQCWSARRLRPLTFPGPANAHTGGGGGAALCPVPINNLPLLKAKHVSEDKVGHRRWWPTIRTEERATSQDEMKAVAACNTGASLLNICKAPYGTNDRHPITLQYLPLYTTVQQSQTKQKKRSVMFSLFFSYLTEREI